MAKTARTPFNSSRYKLTRVSSSRQLGNSVFGDVVLVQTGDDAIELSVSILDNGGYFKILVKDDATQDITITMPALSISGVVVYDVGGGAQLVEVGSQTSITLPTNTVAGSYLDFICDGEKWYVSGMAYGATVSTSA